MIFICKKVLLLFFISGFFTTMVGGLTPSVPSGFLSFMKYKTGRVIRSGKDSFIHYIKHNFAKDIIGGACIVAGSYYAQQEYQKGLKKMLQRKYIFGAVSAIWAGVSILLRLSVRQAIGFPMSLSSGFLLAQQLNMLGNIGDY